MLFDERIENPDTFPVISIKLDEFKVIGRILVLIVEAFVPEDNMEADIPVPNINITFVLINQLTSRKKYHAGIFTKILIAVIDEFGA